MFARIGRGWEFGKQAVAMARADRDLVKPSFYAIVVGIIFSILAAIPLLIIYTSTPEDGQNTVAAIGGFVILVVNYLVSYFFSAMTIHLIYQYLTDGDGVLSDAYKAAMRNLFTILILAIISAIVRTATNAIRRDNRGSVGSSILSSIVAGIIDVVWTTATYFILPAIVIENLSLGAALKRSTRIIKENLLMVAVGHIGVGFVAFLISLIFIIVGFVLAALIFSLLSVVSSTVAFIAAAVVLGLALAIVMAASSYLSTAYYTSLFLWARNVEQDGQGAVPPAPLAAVLN